MTTAHVFIAASIDSYIARKDGDISWLTPQVATDDDHGYAAFYDTVSGIIMGRGTWQVVAGFEPWPFEKPVIVLSATLSQDDIPARLQEKVRVWNLSPAEALQRVGDEGWSRAYIDGGKLIRSFLAAGLIEDLILTRIPILLGDGLPLFADLPEEISLQHLRSNSFPSGFVQSHYRVVR